MGAHLHRGKCASRPKGLGQLSLQMIGKACGVHRCDAMPGPTVLKRSEEGGSRSNAAG